MTSHPETQQGPVKDDKNMQKKRRGNYIKQGKALERSRFFSENDCI